MKKKITLALLAFVCALCCAFGLAACNNKECIGIVASYGTSEKTGNVDLGDYVYGEDDKINENLAKVKFYKHFDDGSDEEISVSELTVEYNDGSIASVSKPDKYYCHDGNFVDYQFNYSLSGTTNTVQVSFDVEPATRDDFSIELSKAQWKHGEKSATITVKNFNGTVMQSNEIGTDMKKDDTDYSNMNLYALPKSNYDRITTENKKNYELFTTKEDDNTKPNYGYNKYFGSDLKYYSPDADQYQMTLSPGEYVLIACVGNTNNYNKIVCATEFTVGEPDSPIGKTSVLTDVRALIFDENVGLKPLTDETVLAQVAELKSTQLGKTAICDAQGNVTGTCNLGLGAFDELTGDNAFKMTFNDEDLLVEVKNNNNVQLSGDYVNGTLTLYLELPLPDKSGNYTLEYTFTLQDVII